MEIIHDKRLKILEETKWCCKTFEKFDYDMDSDIYRDVVSDDRYDVVKQEWIKESEPFVAIVYKSPGYYGDVDSEYLKINNCPFCGDKLTLRGSS